MTCARAPLSQRGLRELLDDAMPALGADYAALEVAVREAEDNLVKARARATQAGLALDACSVDSDAWHMRNDDVAEALVQVAEAEKQVARLAVELRRSVRLAERKWPTVASY